MLKIVFLTLLVVSSVSAICKTLFCPKQPGSQISCDQCHTCLNTGSRYCYTSDQKNCQCATAPEVRCVQENPSASFLNYTFCLLLDDMSIPTPEIVNLDSHSVSAVVARFFQEPPFDSLKPSYLYLLALFEKTKDSKCKTVGSIEAYDRQNSKCLIRVRLQMPKIDYTGTENYYYDDRSPLETQFSRDIFGEAKFIMFWAETTVRKEEKLQNGSASFTTVLRSKRIRHELN
ncbi:unnamed protein product [Caenorhabditis bovis]|uniref:Uncharacterized protein n=1 Tax=Caenorhabditis bovis TaxID=2654633 RepID=A0A8S1EVW6_9PELO|nr:unnamed protein product [Caenorhabditis bovis]